MTQLKDGGRQPGNREERSLSASTVIARWQGNGWDEPSKSRGLRTVLWAAGGEIPPADPAAQNPRPGPRSPAPAWLPDHSPSPRPRHQTAPPCSNANQVDGADRHDALSC